MTRALLSALLLIGAAFQNQACVHGPPAPVAISVWRPGEERQLSEREESLFSPEIRLAWAGDSWRGSVVNELVELETSGTKIKGFVGSSPVDLTVEVADAQTTVRGLFRAEQGELRIDAETLEGKIGRCSYDLRSLDGKSYSGYRSCRAPAEPARVTINTLGAHPLSSGRIAPLLLMLSR